MIAGGEESNGWSKVWYPLEAPSPDVDMLVYVCCVVQSPCAAVYCVLVRQKAWHVAQCFWEGFA